MEFQATSADELFLFHLGYVTLGLDNAQKHWWQDVSLTDDVQTLVKGHSEQHLSTILGCSFSLNF